MIHHGLRRLGTQILPVRPGQTSSSGKSRTWGWTGGQRVV
jgi:hypothetical protein